MTEIGKLEDEALKRKERLKQLRQKRAGEAADSAEKRQAAGENLPKPVFRSYKPQDESLAELKLPPPPLVDVEKKVEDQLEAAKPEPLIEEIDLTKLAPRKPDWDLKRDIAKKLEKLERRTQRAIAELIRERLKKEGDLATVAQADITQESEVD